MVELAVLYNIFWLLHLFDFFSFCLFIQDEKSTLFLIAAYARYNCPYVWVRSNHERLVSFTGGGDDESKLKDSPLKLKTTTAWKQKGKNSIFDLILF